jgi:Cu(I)/Ag(I) efflux system membrane fusion protein
MSDSDKAVPEDQSAEQTNPPAVDASAAKRQRRESVRWWIKLVVQPALFLAACALLIVGLGVVQRLGWISAGGGGGPAHHASVGNDSRYICPMMCTPPQSEPGRCPVCAMELVPAAASGGGGDHSSIQIDPAARRVANIRTATVESAPLTRNIRAIGEIRYDEGAMSTISAYVDGRLDRLYADYTGVEVKKGDHLTLLYSPELYSCQVELTETKKALSESQSSNFTRVVESQRRLYDSARQKLIELGMTEDQVVELEAANEANSRMHICSPMSGTVIEKLAVEGQYVKAGQAIYRIADLSTVWLMLELFPEDAASIRYGQKVETEVQSLQGRKFSGRVAFIDPVVNPTTRTVGVRIVMENERGLFRIGDYAKANIEVPLATTDDEQEPVYDSELAGKWISPRHPHVVESEPGKCRVCNIDLVPAADFGFTDEPTDQRDALIVPRDAVLMAGNSSVVYIETEPGRFEIRRVVLGPSIGDHMVIRQGIAQGEQVAVAGNFLIDSQMQLAGKPSLIDPTRAIAKASVDEPKLAKIVAALSKLSVEDRAMAEAQNICPVTMMPLGSMGTPLKVDVDGREVFICCKACTNKLLKEPEQHLGNLLLLVEPGEPSAETPSELPKAADLNITEALLKLAPADRALAQTQRICPVTAMPLGSMGTPSKVDVNGKLVFICCEACRDSLLTEPVKHLAKLPQEAVR